MQFVVVPLCTTQSKLPQTTTVMTCNRRGYYSNTVKHTDYDFIVVFLSSFKKVLGEYLA